MLLDTSGLFAYFHRGDPNHREAVALYESGSARLTHSYVLAEFVALAMARRLPRIASLEFVEAAVANPDIEVVWVDALLHMTGLRFLMTRPDRTYSLCDAVSFLIMRERGISAALSTDHHFEQEGFARLLHAI